MARLGVALATLVGALASVSQPAGAAVFVVTAPAFPESVAVGETFPASVSLQNASTPPESLTPLTISNIDLVPACGTATPGATCAGNVDPGVFSVSLAGNGVGPPTCTGTWTISQTSAGVWRLEPPGGNGSLSLPAAQTCQVNFTATALRIPTADVNPVGGVQTTQVASSTPSVLGQVFAPNQGADITTVTRPTPGLSTSAASTPPQAFTPPSVPGTTTDTALLGSPPPPSSVNGNAPTGTITFNLYGPTDNSCANVPVFTNTVPVNGFGSYPTSAVAPITSPGVYRWKATYSGDANYVASSTACGDPNETIAFRQAQPAISTTASQSVIVGQFVSDTAALSGAFVPTGTINFRLYGPDDVTCSGAAVYTSTAGVNSNGTYFSGSFAPTLAGTYRWTVAYSGDANNAAVAAPCNDVNEAVVVNRATPFLITNVSSANTTVNRPITDVAALSGGYNPTGAMTFRLFGPDDANCTVSIFTSTVALSGSTNVTSGPFTPAAPGTYRWTATYSGDVNNNAVAGLCNSPGEAVTVRKPAPPADFDGDGKADIAVFRPQNGVWFIKGSAGGVSSVPWGANGDVPVAGDYDGDGKADLAVFRPSTGTWYVLRSSAGSVAVVWGTPGDMPVVGDFDGDGRTDFTVFRPGTGEWFVNRSTGGTTSQVWGVPGDFPAPGDFDNDGKTDLTVWRPGTGTWFVSRSSGGATSTAWGVAGDFPTAGDFDGDGKADFGAYRPTSGTWFVSKSGGGAVSVAWGALNDRPAVADYDGDKKADFTVFRPSEGTWYVLGSGGSASSAPWGASGDIPIPPPVA